MINKLSGYPIDNSYLYTIFNKACIRNVTIFMICIRNVGCTNRVVYETSCTPLHTV